MNAATEIETSSLALSANATGQGTRLVHHWSKMVGAGRAAEGLRADWQHQLRDSVADAGFEYIRFHGLFHDDMFVYRLGEGGEAVFNFQYVDALFDALLESGIKPFVEFGLSPRDLARTTETVFWWKSHGDLPTNLAAWSDLIEEITRHWIGRYGADEVRSWYFEVWNEPNLKPFFGGSRSEYFALYEATARAVKRVDPALRVGGPATSNFVPDSRFDGETEDYAAQQPTLDAPNLDDLNWKPVWVEAFLDFCRDRDVPLDFVSVHPYPTDWALDAHGQGRKLTREVDATPKDLALMKEILAGRGLEHLELHVTEWSSSSSPRDHTHDFIQAAAYIVRTNLATIGLTDSLSYWTFTDVFEEGGAGDEPLHGGFGMVTVQGVKKPTAHAFRMLNRLGNELLAQEKHGVVTRSPNGNVQALLTHYPPEITQSVPASFDSRTVAWETRSAGTPAQISLTLEGLRPGQPFTVEILDQDHGDLVAAWRALGEPQRWNKQVTAALGHLANATELIPARANEQGTLELSLTVKPWSVVLVESLGS